MMNKKYFIKISIVLIFFGLSKYTQAQEFSSSEKISEHLLKVEVVFDEINSIQVAEKIIDNLRGMEGVTDVELFYPTTNNGYLIISPNTTAKSIINRLSQINVELDTKSFKK